MSARPLLLATLLLVACDTVTAPSATSTPAPAISGGAPGSSSRPAEPPLLPAARPGIRATGVGAIPALFRYVALDTPLADGFRTRLWLVDLGSKRAPALAAEWDAPAAPVGGYSVSSDGRTVVISAAGTRSRVALYVARPETGDTRVLYEDPATIVLSPRISPDGTRYAFTKYPAEGGKDLGIWAGRTSGGDAKRVSEPSTASNVPQLAVAWSPDAAWLAFTRDLERAEVRAVPGDGGDEIRIGPGDKVSWRRTAPELLVAESVAPASRIYAVDLASGKATELVKLDKVFVPTLDWDPSGTRFVYAASENAAREASGGIWLRAPDGVATRLDVGRTFLAPQWSRDGALLSALAGGDDSRIPIVDLLSGRQLSVLCRRGGTPPADCL